MKAATAGFVAVAFSASLALATRHGIWPPLAITVVLTLALLIDSLRRYRRRRLIVFRPVAGSGRNCSASGCSSCSASSCGE